MCIKQTTSGERHILYFLITIGRRKYFSEHRLLSVALNDTVLQDLSKIRSRHELESMISAMHNTSNGQPKVEVYADIILNHISSSDEDAEINPAVKQYVFDEAYRNGDQYVSYPTNGVGN